MTFKSSILRAINTKVSNKMRKMTEKIVSVYTQGCVSYSSPLTGPEWPRGFQEVKVPRFHDNGTGWW